MVSIFAAPPQHLIKAKQTGIIWLGLPKIYNANCSTDGGFFSCGDDDHRIRSMAIHILSYVWMPVHKYASQAVELIFIDAANHVSTLILYGESFQNFAAIVYASFHGGPGLQPIDLRGVVLQMAFEERMAQVSGTDKAYYPVTFTVVAYVPEPEYQGILAFIESGICPLLDEQDVEVMHE